MTGEIKLISAVAGFDVGTPINVNAVRGQAVGGLHMGLGYAGAEDEIRTRDLLLGKEAFYH